MKRPLIILSNNFGTNFSGGSLATCKIFETIEDDFSKIIVIANQVGMHSFQNIHHYPYQGMLDAIRIIKKINQTEENPIFYGDFYMTYYFILAGVPFYFTYHDNWPEQKKLNFDAAIDGFFFIPVYRWIFKKAKAVIHVSQHKLNQNKMYNAHSYLVRNGINAALTKTMYQPFSPGEPLRIIMIGTIDERKFDLGIEFFSKLIEKVRHPNIQVDIFGHVQDHIIATKLSEFRFVNIQGFKNDINFSNYDLMLSVSKMENLSIAVCESLFNLTPVLTFNIGGLKEIIIQNETGMLISNYDTGKMVESLERIMRGQIKFKFDNQDLSPYDWNKAGQKYKKILTGTFENELMIHNTKSA